jgi:predicted RND superfamily exporter protein
VFLALQIGKMKVVFSAEDLAGQGLPSADELKTIKDRYKDGGSSLVLITPPEGQVSFSIEQLCQLRKWYSYQRNSMPELKISTSTFDFVWPVRESERVVRYHNVLDLDCVRGVLRDAPEDIRNSLNQSPFGLANENKKRLSLLFQFTYNDSTTSKFGVFDPKPVSDLRQAFQEEVLPLVPGAKIFYLGSADYQWYILEGFNFSKYTNLAMLIFMMIGLRIFFGTWRSGFVFCFSLLIASIWVFGLKALTGSSFDVMSTGLMLIVGIASMEDFVFVSYEQLKSPFRWRRSLRIMIIPGFFTSLTTVVGFLSLYISDVEAIRRMGVWSASGVLIEWAVIFVFLPALFSQFKGFAGWVDPRKALGFAMTNRFKEKNLPKFAARLCLLVFPLALWASHGIDYNESPHRIFPSEQEYSRGIRELLSSRGWMGTVALVFDQPLEMNAVEAIVQDILKIPAAQKQIVRYESPRNISDWLARKGQLPREDSELHFKISRIQSQYVDDSNRARVLLYVRDTSVEPILELKEIAKHACGGRCHLAGEVVAYADFAGLVPKTLADSLLTSLVLVGLIILWIATAQGKLALVPSLLLSSFWGPVLMLLILGATHSTLDFWKSIFASILVGLTGDNAIQYLFASQKRKSLQRGITDRGGASLITGVLMAITSLVYLGSYFRSPKTFGLILCAGLLTSLAGDLWLLKALLPKPKGKAT